MHKLYIYNICIFSYHLFYFQAGNYGLPMAFPESLGSFPTTANNDVYEIGGKKCRIGLQCAANKGMPKVFAITALFPSIHLRIKWPP